MRPRQTLADGSRYSRVAMLALALAIAVVASWGGVGVQARQFTVGATIWDMSVPFYANFIKGLHDGAAQYDLRLLLRDGQGDPNKQIAVVQQFIAERVDLILIVPGDAQAVVPVIRQANAAGIPVVAVNNRVGEGARVVTFVGADDYYFGQQQGKLLVQAIGTSGRFALLMGKLGTSAQILRRKGLEDYLASYPDIKMVSAISTDWDSAKSLAATQDLLSRYGKGQLDAIVSQGPEAVPGVYFAHKAGRSEIKWVLGDYPKDVAEVIRAGLAFGTVLQDPYPQAVEGMRVAKLYLTGDRDAIPTPNDFLELPLITQENVNEYEPVW